MTERTRSHDETEEIEDEAEVQETQTVYSEAMQYFEEVRGRVEHDYVVTSEEAIQETNEQGELSFYSLPYFDDVVLPDMKVFKERIRNKSGRHTHQGGFIILALKGEGESFVDGEVIPWEAGDMILIPFKPGGVEHQHFNRNDEDEPAEWLAINYAPHLEHVGALFVQNETYSDFDSDREDVKEDDGSPLVNPEFADFEYSDWRDYEPPEETETLYDDFIVRRNLYRKQVAKSQEDNRWAKIGEDDIEWEVNPQGKMKWYIHPAYDNHSVQSFFSSVQEIPPGSKSGKQHRQGQLIHYILEGSGYSVINGDRYEWSKGDYVGLPVTPAGNTIQHFNDSDKPVRMFRNEPFEHEAVGYDLGCGFKQLEACPEYDGDLPDE